MQKRKQLLAAVAGLLFLYASHIASADIFGDLKKFKDLIETAEEVPEEPVPMPEAEPHLDLVNTGASTSSPLDQLAGQDVLTGTLTGAALGAAIGALADGSDGAKKGALIGAAAGFVAGNVAAQRRKQFASEDAFLDAEIQAAENAVTTKEGQLTTLDTELASTRRKVAMLEYRFEQNEDITAEAEQEMQALSARIAENDQTAEQYQNSIDYLDEVLRTSEAESLAKSEDRATWEEREATLIAKRSDLNQQYARLTGINDGMKNEQLMLAGLLQKAKDRG